MMGNRTVTREALFYQFSIERHVPPDHLLRPIDRFVDLSGPRSHLRPFCSKIGRPSIDPELMIRLLIAGYCFGIDDLDAVSGFDALDDVGSSPNSRLNLRPCIGKLQFHLRHLDSMERQQAEFMTLIRDRYQVESARSISPMGLIGLPDPRSILSGMAMKRHLGGKR